jgi:hypothetical protein
VFCCDFPETMSELDFLDVDNLAGMALSTPGLSHDTAGLAL